MESFLTGHAEPFVTVQVGDKLLKVNPDDYVDDFQHLSRYCTHCGEHFDQCLCDVPITR